jgi:hypothetical protein
MEQSFGADLSDVRVHDDAPSAEAAGSIGAAAFTFGRDISFAAGRFRPDTARGRRLLAHELAHTVQQRGASEDSQPVGSPASSARAIVSRRTH